ncbi:MAG TPA: hypothetical protein VFA77_17600, partial [Candidatus Eisenbacteria bacterium]|nr:hypothetical protein [Candidatus Eisenbacteria bacterium]
MHCTLLDFSRSRLLGLSFFLVLLGLLTPPTAKPATAALSFTNLAERLLHSQLNSGLTQIQIYPTNQYTVAVHRLLQVAANFCDAATNSPYPSVFRPRFSAADTNGNVFIGGYYQDNDVNTVNDWLATNPYGIPMVIGAKKGLPNFNEVSLATAVQVIRRLELWRQSPTFGTRPSETNHMYQLSISNLFGVEAWNSYSTNTHPGGTYPRPLDMMIIVTTTISLTNQDGLNLTLPAVLSVNSNITSWPVGEFKVPLLTNLVVLSNAVYRTASPPRFDEMTSLFERGVGFPIPELLLTISNRLSYTLSENGRIIDCVILNDLVTVLNIMREMITGVGYIGEPPAVSGAWRTNRLGDSTSVMVPTLGVINQMAISLGNQGVSLADWNSYSLQNVSGRDKEKAIQFFKGYVGGSNQSYFLSNGLIIPTGLMYQAPFSPVRKLVQSTSWQVNDPLVHYMLDDLKDSANNTVIQFIKPTDRVPTNSNLGTLNLRYRPWGGNPLKDSAGDSNTFYVGVKDPGVRRSDDWDFPTNEFQNGGELGRVHRGTAWQTVYLKSEVAPMNRWRLLALSPVTHPTNDWRLAGLLISLLSTNDPRSLFSINQTDPDAWTQVLHGMTVLSNTIFPPPQFDLLLMESNSPQAQIIADGINRTRSKQPGQHFRDVGDILATPGLTTASPWLNLTNDILLDYGMTDEAYEKIPEQLLRLLRPDPIISLNWVEGRWQ